MLQRKPRIEATDAFGFVPAIFLQPAVPAMFRESPHPSRGRSACDVRRGAAVAV
jgi:hypothetical protein